MGITEVLRWAAVGVAAYLLGSIPVGYLVSRTFGRLDIRRYGSGNVGATNVTRVLGAKLGALVLAGDVAKGALASWIGLCLIGAEGGVAAGVLAVVGHAWPIFLRFSGGKSVATGLGALVVLSAPVAAVLVVIWAGVVLATRYVSLASMVSASTAPVWLWLAFHDWLVVGGAALMSLIVLYRHHANVRRLLAGREHRAY